MKHYSEVDLLERYYIPSPEMDEVGKHLASCQPCAERYALLSGKLRDSACTSVQSLDRKPDTFWIRQRMSVGRKIEQQSSRRRSAGKTARLAAIAAVFTVVFGGGLLYRNQIASWNPPAAVATSSVPAAEFAPLDVLAAISALDDVWESEELKPFGEAVQWESWMTSPANSSGGTL